jgi:two-component system sensor histidine kinase HydH
METLFSELKRYVGWTPDDEAALRELHPLAAPHFSRIADGHYDRILAHDEARKALIGGESRVGQLKVSLIAWMDRLLSGPWDEGYYELRCRIGRVHVRIALPQHYMFGAMNLIRRELNDLIDTHYQTQPVPLRRARTAVGRILDLELAIMLHTYREDLEAQQARKERLATFGQLIGSIGHELRNPLGVIESSLYILRQRVGDDERALKHVGRIGEQLQLANGIVGSLLDMIRDKPLVREKVALAQAARSVLVALSLPPDVQVTCAGLDELPAIDGDATQLRQVLFNLLENAIYAAAPSGRVQLAGRRDGAMVELAVEDSGPGVDVEALRRLFEPLVTTKANGIGLGLALVKRIVQRHGGDVTYAPRAGGGARFVVRLPVAEAAGDAAATS